MLRKMFPFWCVCSRLAFVCVCVKVLFNFLTLVCKVYVVKPSACEKKKNSHNETAYNLVNFFFNFLYFFQGSLFVRISDGKKLLRRQFSTCFDLLKLIFTCFGRFLIFLFLTIFSCF